VGAWYRGNRIVIRGGRRLLVKTGGSHDFLVIRNRQSFWEIIRWVNALRGFFAGERNFDPRVVIRE